MTAIREKTARANSERPIAAAICRGVPKELDPANSSIALPTSAVPVRSSRVTGNVVSIGTTVSEEGARSGVDGADGTDESMVIVEHLTHRTHSLPRQSPLL